MEINGIEISKEIQEIMLDVNILNLVKDILGKLDCLKHANLEIKILNDIILVTEKNFFLASFIYKMNSKKYDIKFELKEKILLLKQNYLEK